jgi:hypothetical protein
MSVLDKKNDNSSDYYIVRPHIASFNYPHNHVKALVFLYLYYFRFNNGGRYLSARVIAENTGTRYGSLVVLLERWCRWNYTARRKGKSCYLYHLCSRGEDFIRYRVPADIRMALDDKLAARASK